MKKCMGCMADYEDQRDVCPVCGFSDKAAAEEHAKAPDAIPAGTILQGRFIVGRILSFTDFSAIYLAWDALLRRRIVIREFYPYGLCRREESGLCLIPVSEEAGRNMKKCITLFEKETAMVGNCQEMPEVLNYYRSFQENGTVYNVTEYLEGITLEDSLSMGERYTHRQSELLVRRLCSVLVELHRRGVTHGNLTPSSVYLCGEDIVLIDFGMTKRELTRILGAKKGVLDPRYSAPEILRGDADKTVDYYSAGAIFLWLLTGREPSAGGRKRFAVKGDERAAKLIARLTSNDGPTRREGAASMAERYLSTREDGVYGSEPETEFL